MSQNMKKISDIFGQNIFDYESMREKLPKQVYKELVETIEKSKMLNIELANTVAHAMKEWAIELGATHFTHWFQPLNRGTAEKHDSFLEIDSFFNSTNTIERFSGSQLVQAEPDASSFPSGGMRSTFEARGYTAWDPTSPAFIIEHANGKTLCIPSVFISYTGDALDKKTPLLRSLHLLDVNVKTLLNLLQQPTESVYSTVGPEQEFFLIPLDLFKKRPDLKLTGRTIFGKPSPKGQKLEDHYFGSIPEHILKFLSELEQEAYKLGIPLKTRHNEVAPSQFELAPIYEHANVANDHNQLLMELLRKVALRHNIACLLHEKPFANVNGSGKHNNWSIQTYEGINLLNPGKSREDNYRFLLILSIILHGVYKRAKVLRTAIATPGNDFRLGANEAPPAIISVFIGTELEKLLNKIAEGEDFDVNTLDEEIDTQLEQLPNIKKHNTDRNRTSPFAFTGDKFEFRAVGSSQTLGFPNAYLNTIVAEAFAYATSILQQHLQDKSMNTAVLETVKQLYSEAKPIVFNGDNYSNDWVKQASSRGLPNIENSFEALKILLEETTINLFQTANVLTEKEIRARYNIQMKNLVRQQVIEAELMIDMIKTGVKPMLLQYLAELAPIAELLQDDDDYNNLLYSRVEVSTYIKELQQIVSKIENNNDLTEKGKIATYELKPVMYKLRTLVDEIEKITPANLWPWPNYVELLHEN